MRGIIVYIKFLFYWTIRRLPPLVIPASSAPLVIPAKAGIQEEKVPVLCITKMIIRILPLPPGSPIVVGDDKEGELIPCP